MTLVLEAVRKDVGAETHLSDVSLTLERGSLNVLLGATLAGKTSLMRLMAGLDAPIAGPGAGRRHRTSPAGRCSAAASRWSTSSSSTTRRSASTRTSPRRCGSRACRRARSTRGSREAARLLKLEPYLDRKPLNLSGGQQQRTAIARALVKRADLVLLDEPLANLDYKLREELREELPRIFAASGAIFVYATTEPQEALLLGGNTATLYEGRVTQFGPTPQVYRAPAGHHHRAGLLRPAAQHAHRPQGRRRRGARAPAGEARAAGAFARGPGRRLSRSASAPTT